MTFILALLFIVSVLIVFVVLIQNPKGAGLNASMGGNTATQIMGVHRGTDFFEKATWFLGTALLVLSICSVMFLGGKTGETRNIETKATAPNALPSGNVPVGGQPTAPLNATPQGQPQQTPK